MLRVTLAAGVCASGLAAAQPAPPPRDGPSIDCAKRVYAVDTLICDDPVLRSQNYKIENLYRSDIASLRDSQDVWAKQRNMCVFKVRARACVMKLQAARLRQLEKIVRPLDRPSDEGD